MALFSICVDNDDVEYTKIFIDYNFDFNPESIFRECIQKRRSNILQFMIDNYLRKYPNPNQ